MKKALLYFVLISSLPSFAQLFQGKTEFTRQDTLRGSITPERAWWNLTYYHLDVAVKPSKKYIEGKNTIYYKVLDTMQVMQIDLQYPMEITKAEQNGKKLHVKSEGNAHLITLKQSQKIDSINSLIIHFKGHPQEAKNAPWDGGFSWTKDKNDNHFIATSNQGLGASVWWPNKDHAYDEPDSMLISVTNPKGLTNVSNGRLKKLEEHNETVTSHWFVANPINNYGVNINIGDYVHFSEIYQGVKGNLDMDYYVLSYNLEKAKKHFVDAPRLIEALEHWYGPFPFYEDSFKLVEVPYLGMEHQSSITYGNKYKKGYLGSDLSGTGWGLKFDFIIIHEAGHEWFANSITAKDPADMWIHEGFTTYAESLFLDYHYGKKMGAEYIVGLRNKILNVLPLIGPYHVNKESTSDVYYKGANILHTLRQWVDNDEKWRSILKATNEKFYHQTIDSKQIEAYLSEKTDMNLTAFFNQYLRDIRIPTLEYKIKDNELSYRYTDVVEGFDMPIKVLVDGVDEWLYPNKSWKTKNIKTKTINVDKNFYIDVKKL